MPSDLYWDGTHWVSLSQAGIPGKNGLQGKKGDKGDFTAINVGIVTALAAGSTPTVRTRQVNPGVVRLDFGIPTAGVGAATSHLPTAVAAGELVISTGAGANSWIASDSFDMGSY